MLKSPIMLFFQRKAGGQKYLITGYCYIKEKFCIKYYRKVYYGLLSVILCVCAKLKS